VLLRSALRRRSRVRVALRPAGIGATVPGLGTCRLAKVNAKWVLGPIGLGVRGWNPEGGFGVIGAWKRR
jgi:hypothetical protein